MWSFCKKISNNARLNLIAVSRTVLKLVGNNFLVEVKLAGGRNKVLVSLNNFEKANSLCTIYTDLEAYNFEAAISSFKIMRFGIIKNIPQVVSEETIFNEFSSPIKIISLARYEKMEKISLSSRNSSWLNSKTRIFLVHSLSCMLSSRCFRISLVS